MTARTIASVLSPPLISTTVAAVGDPLPDPVASNIAELGGWLVFVVDFLAAVHLVYLGASIALLHFSDHRLPVPAGQWFAKLMGGIWICAAAGTIAALVVGT